jgi:hypothetical protein
MPTSRVAQVRIINSADATAYWDLTATAATQDTAAGATVNVSCVVSASAGTLGAPAAPTNADIYFLADDQATLIKTIVLTPSANTSTQAFTFTDTGAAGGVNRAGVIRLKVRVRQTAGLAATQYDISSEPSLYGSPANTLATGSAAGAAQVGFIRGTMTATTTLAASTDAIPVAMGYGNTLTATTVLGAAPYVSRTVQVALTGIAAVASGASTSTTFTTALGLVDNRFSSASVSRSTTTTFPNAGLVAIGWTASTPTEATVTVDPRFTKVGLLQVNSNAWGTLPLSKDVAAHQRLTSDLAFLSMRYRNANGAGINGLSVGHVLADSAGLVAVITWADTTAVEGTEAGWCNTLQPWSSALPGGFWSHTTTVTAPSTATGLETGTDTLTLLAKNPNYQVVVGLTLASPGAEADHAHFGDNLTASLVVLNVASDFKVPIDAGSAVVSLIRYNAATSLLEALATNGTTWSTWSTGVLPTIPMTVNPNDPNLWQYTFTSTAGWGATDVIAAQVQCKINGTPYGMAAPRELVSTAANGHAKYALDVTGLFK